MMTIHNKYILILHNFLFLILLLTCFFSMSDVRHGCQINGDVEYLKTVPLITLHIGRDEHITLPTPYNDYNIPDFSNVLVNNQKIGKALNICPPVALDMYVCDNSCIFDNENDVFD